MTGRNLPKIQQPREPEPSTINEKTIADFMRVVEQTGILERGPLAAPCSRSHLIGTINASLRNHKGKGVERANECAPARWRLSQNKNLFGVYKSAVNWGWRFVRQ